MGYLGRGITPVHSLLDSVISEVSCGCELTACPVSQRQSLGNEGKSCGWLGRNVHHEPHLATSSPTFLHGGYEWGTQKRTDRVSKRGLWETDKNGRGPSHCRSNMGRLSQWEEKNPRVVFRARLRRPCKKVKDRGSWSCLRPGVASGSLGRVKGGNTPPHTAAPAPSVQVTLLHPWSSPGDQTHRYNGHWDPGMS